MFGFIIIVIVIIVIGCALLLARGLCIVGKDGEPQESLDAASPPYWGIVDTGNPYRFGLYPVEDGKSTLVPDDSSPVGKDLQCSSESPGVCNQLKDAIPLPADAPVTARVGTKVHLDIYPVFSGRTSGDLLFYNKHE